MKLQNMSAAEYDFWSQRSRSSYAADKIKANGFTLEEAEKIAANDFNRLLPDGFSSKDNFLLALKDDSAEIHGFIWFCLRGAENNRKAYLCDIVIEENSRGRGFGRIAMQLLEKEVKKLGLKHIGLHVFGFNKVAIGLYESLGYEITDLVMEKSIK
jgi:ribosomal protein S18 acetylase RimI-like enzyme